MTDAEEDDRFDQWLAVWTAELADQVESEAVARFEEHLARYHADLLQQAEREAGRTRRARKRNRAGGL